jgi:sigma-B regulation protein RsbU (phosphoserine phosphatase)
VQALPAVRGLTPQIEAFSLPARTFTGDFWFAHRAHDRLWFAVGDVAGKGLPAAVVMAMIQEELEHRIASCAASACPPQVTMKRLHEFLLPHLPSNRFATAVLGHLHDDGTLTIVNAGHCPPLIARRDGTISLLGSTGPVLGILPGSTWRSIETHLESDETLLLYSDGVMESTSGGEELGVEGVISLLQRVGASPRAIAEALDVTSDDVTIAAVRR